MRFILGERETELFNSRCFCIQLPFPGRCGRPRHDPIESRWPSRMHIAFYNTRTYSREDRGSYILQPQRETIANSLKTLWAVRSRHPLFSRGLERPSFSWVSRLLLFSSFRGVWLGAGRGSLGRSAEKVRLLANSGLVALAQLLSVYPGFSSCLRPTSLTATVFFHSPRLSLRLVLSLLLLQDAARDSSSAESHVSCFEEGRETWKRSQASLACTS